MPDLHVKDGGTWKTVDTAWVKDAGVWKEAGVFVKTGGSWEPVRVPTFNLVISSNTSDYDIESAARSAGWDGVVDCIVNVTINSGVDVTGTSTSFASGAIRTGNFFGRLAQPIRLENNGRIIGKGGNGGAGNVASNNGLPGGGGGNGLLVDNEDPVDLYNYGTISAGGGGGGGGGGGTDNVGADATCTGFEGGGGGGAAKSGLGGSGWNNGGNGGTTGGGSGGDGEGNNDPIVADVGGDGGGGGNWGNNGGGGAAGLNGCNGRGVGGSGGSRGDYIDGDSSVNYIVTGTLRGSVSP